MSTPTMTVPEGVRLSSGRMTVVSAALLFALLGYSVPSNMLVPLLTSLEASYRISAVAAIWISLIALRPAPGAPPGPPLPSIQGFEGFWGLAAGLTLLAAVFAAVYLVTYWSGFRGGDRAMVARPHMEGAGAATS